MENAKAGISEKLQKRVAKIKRQKITEKASNEPVFKTRIKPKAKGPNPLSMKKSKVNPLPIHCFDTQLIRAIL